jgi:ankyrin repeat protein
MDIVQWFLREGANPNATSDTGRSPLWRAAFNGHTEVVRVLLEVRYMLLFVRMFLMARTCITMRARGSYFI